MATTPPTEPQQAGMRLRIAAAARELFATRGYDRTTVDEIAERAGVGRRTFFRYFRSKDEAILPDHVRIMAALEAHLAAIGDLPPVRALCSGATLVFRGYVDEPEVSLQRFRLTRSVPALRARETASVQEYFRIFRRFVAERFAAEPAEPGIPVGSLRADVVAGAVVAAHNQVLREWLRAGAVDDPMPALAAAFEWLAVTFESPSAGVRGGAGADEGPEGRAREQERERQRRGEQAGGREDGGAGQGVASVPENVVVAVFRAGDSIDDVMQRISRQL